MEESFEIRDYHWPGCVVRSINANDKKYNYPKTSIQYSYKYQMAITYTTLRSISFEIEKGRKGKGGKGEEGEEGRRERGVKDI
jgi:hypothetical protein